MSNGHNNICIGNEIEVAAYLYRRWRNSLRFGLRMVGCSPTHCSIIQIIAPSTFSTGKQPVIHIWRHGSREPAEEIRQSARRARPFFGCMQAISVIASHRAKSESARGRRRPWHTWPRRVKRSLPACDQQGRDNHRQHHGLHDQKYASNEHAPRRRPVASSAILVTAVHRGAASCADPGAPFGRGVRTTYDRPPSVTRPARTVPGNSTRGWVGPAGQEV